MSQSKMLSKKEVPKLDFPPPPWSWDVGNGYNSSTYIFYGEDAPQDFDFMEVPDDCGFMAIDEGKLADFIVRRVNGHDALVNALDNLLRETLHEDNLLRNGHLKDAIHEATKALAAVKVIEP